MPWENRITRAGAPHVEQKPWGRLEWHVSAAIGNSQTMTTGRCILEPGATNGRHWHPNCDEILTVLHGRIVQIWDDEEIVLEEGDVVSIPSGVTHAARNIGEDDAVLAIAFSSAYRETIGE